MPAGVPRDPRFEVPRCIVFIVAGAAVQRSSSFTDDREGEMCRLVPFLDCGRRNSVVCGDGWRVVIYCLVIQLLESHLEVEYLIWRRQDSTVHNSATALQAAV